MGFTLAGREGVFNTVGSLGAAMLARNCDVDVVFVGQSFKIAHDREWDRLRRRCLESQGDSWLDGPTKGALHATYVMDRKFDLVPWKFVSRIITEKGEKTGQEFLDPAGSQ